MKQSEDPEREREGEKGRMKGQKGELGRNCLNGTHWDKIGQRKEKERFCGDEGRFLKRGSGMKTAMT